MSGKRRRKKTIINSTSRNQDEEGLQLDFPCVHLCVEQASSLPND